MKSTNFKIRRPFLSCFNNLNGLYFEALVSRFWRGLVGSKFLLFHGSEEESVYNEGGKSGGHQEAKIASQN